MNLPNPCLEVDRVHIGCSSFFGTSMASKLADQLNPKLYIETSKYHVVSWCFLPPYVLCFKGRCHGWNLEISGWLRSRWTNVQSSCACAGDGAADWTLGSSKCREKSEVSDGFSVGDCCGCIDEDTKSRFLRSSLWFSHIMRRTDGPWA